MGFTLSPVSLLLTLSLLLSFSCASRSDSRENVIRPFAGVGSPTVGLDIRRSEAERLEAAGEQVPTTAKFQPNAIFNGGLALGWRGSALSWSVPLARQREADGDRGSSEGRDTQYHGAWGYGAIDYVNQSYRGFYSERNSQDGSKPVFETFPDMTMKRQVLTVSFMSHPNRFNYNAAFNQMQVIDKNGFTFIGALTADRTRLENLPEELNDALYRDALINTADYLTYGLTGGGAVTGVIPRIGVFASLMVTTGPAWQQLDLGLDGGEVVAEKRRETLKTSYRMVLGVDRGSWFFGSSSWGDSSYVRNDTHDVELSSRQIEGFIGARF